MIIQSLSASVTVSGLAVIAAQVFVLYCVLWTIYTRTLHPLSKVPGPFFASVTRLWLVVNTLRGHVDDVERSLHQKYGPIVRVAPDEVVCAEPDCLPKIYRTQNALAKTDFYPVWASARRVFTKHLDLFSETSNKKHGERRRIVSHIYTLANILRFEVFIDECTELFLHRIGQLADENQIVDIGEWFSWYTFDVIGQLYFGRMFGFMKESHDHESWISALDMLTPYLLAMAVSPSYTRPFIGITAIFSKAARNALKSMDRIVDAARKYVGQRQETPAYSADGTPRRDLLQQMLEVLDEKGEKMDFSIGDIQSEAHVALFAGSVTTATAMRSVIYYLLKNIDIYRQLQAEIDEAATKGNLSSPVRYAEAIKLPFFCATVKEALRLHPSVGMSLTRVSPAGGIELVDHDIPEGYRVGMNAAVLQHDKTIFGADADTFRPARWLEGNAVEMDKYMLVWSAGSRTCIGKNIAMSEVHKLLPNLLREFELELVDPAKVWTTSNMFLHAQSGVRVRVKRRSHGVSDGK